MLKFARVAFATSVAPVLLLGSVCLAQMSAYDTVSPDVQRRLIGGSSGVQCAVTNCSGPVCAVPTGCKLSTTGTFHCECTGIGANGCGNNTFAWSTCISSSGSCSPGTGPISCGGPQVPIVPMCIPDGSGGCTCTPSGTCAPGGGSACTSCT